MGTNKKQGELLCTHFQPVSSVTYDTSTMPDSSCRMDRTSDGYIYFRHDASNLSTGAFCEWLESQYLNGTPVMIVFERVTSNISYVDYKYYDANINNTVDSDSKLSATIDISYRTT